MADNDDDLKWWHLKEVVEALSEHSHMFDESLSYIHQGQTSNHKFNLVVDLKLHAMSLSQDSDYTTMLFVAFALRNESASLLKMVTDINVMFKESAKKSINATAELVYASEDPENAYQLYTQCKEHINQLFLSWSAAVPDLQEGMLN